MTKYASYKQMMVRVLEKKMNRDPLRSSKLKDFLIGIGKFSRRYISLNLGLKLFCIR